ncbi:hypothetical protein [Alkalibacillus silvisoli]|uniref:Zinc ribbon domain-containing protein n=1 Tax=Alkalibacillus silvisoli TaxID=392823 RepID=A0ABP3K239_9BACI
MITLVCENCQHQQEEGRFCENCGKPISNDSGSNESPDQQEDQSQDQGQSQASESKSSNAQLDQAKNFTKNYWEYFISTLKNPNLALKQQESSYINGIITLVIMSLTLSLGVYFLLNGLFSQLVGGFGVDESVPFFGTVSRLVLGTILIAGTGLLALIISLKIGKVNQSFKTTLAQYGALAVPFSVLAILSIITGLSTSAQFTLILLFASLIAFTLVAPVLLTTYNLTKSGENGQFVYNSIASFFMTVIFMYILFNFYIDSLVNNLENMVMF